MLRGPATELRSRLRRIAGALLAQRGTSGSWRTAAVALSELFSEIAPLAPNEAVSPDHEATVLAGGKAISTVDAARCISDTERTRAFLTGIAHTVWSGGREPVHVLYAGTGPYAPLVVPLTTIFEPERLRVTLVDVHPTSIERLDAVVRALALEPYLEAVHCADAACFDPPRSPPVDVLVVETMQRALTREPQVAILRHLLRRLPDTVVLVPRVVTITASLVTPGATTSDGARALGEVLAMDAAWARSAISELVPAATLQLDEPARPDQVLTLDTRITVADGIEIPEGASGLTLPHHLSEVPVDRAPATLSFAYRVASDPGLVCSVTEPWGVG